MSTSPMIVETVVDANARPLLSVLRNYLRLTSKRASGLIEDAETGVERRRSGDEGRGAEGGDR